MIPPWGKKRAQRVFLGMDLYRILKVPSNANQIEIDRAYRKLLKEAQFDPTIRMKEVELAYRILSDGTHRALYDVKAGYTKRDKKTGKLKPTAKKKPVSAQKRLKIESSIAISLFVIMVIYMVFRFGFYLRKFEAGDLLFFRDDNRYFGTLMQLENSHAFGPMKVDAYLIKLPSKDERWYPQGDVKSLCYRRE